MHPRLVHITTVPESLGFLTGQLRFMQLLGWDVHAISSPGPLLEAFGKDEGIKTHPIEMPRRITPANDLKAVAKLAHQLWGLAPTIVHSHTPKGGLLGMLAASAARVPVRIYHMHGLPFTTASGLRRQLLKTTERTSCRLAHKVLCQSHSLKTQALQQSVCSQSKIHVMGSGSLGIDALQRFNPVNYGSTRSTLREQIGWNEDHIVIGFVGRLVGDKGIADLAEAWRTIREQSPEARLLLVGPFESEDPVPPQVRLQLEKDPTIHLAGFSHEPAKWYSAMDIFVLPSYREGFPTVPLEAAAMNLPVVTTSIPGSIDSVIPDVTGTLVPPRAPSQLATGIIRYINDRTVRRKHGEAGRERVIRDFSRENIWQELAATYKAMASAKGRNAPSPDQ